MLRPFIICMFSLLTGTLYAQVSSSANASATIMSEVGITELQGNNFINFAATKYNIQQVNSAGVSMLTNSKTVELLSFTIISNEHDFSITLPSTYHLAKKDDGPGYITAALFVSPSLKTNNQSISISTSFKENNFQSPGNYYSAPLEITINYN